MTDSHLSSDFHNAALHDEFFEELDVSGSEALPDVWQPLLELLSLHPKYHGVFKSAIDQLFYGNGPLPMTERHYIALMAASRHSCTYLMDLHRREFERLGGESDWLNGLTAAPSKLVRLDAINKVLGHQPWSITVDQLKTLTKCSAPDNWSLTELVQGVVILSTTHALCSFVFGCGNINPSELTPQELDAPMMRRSPRASEDSPGGEVEELMKRMAALRDLTNGADCTDEDKARHFLDMNRESSAISLEPNGDKKSGRSPPRPGAQFTKDLSFIYVDFAQRPDASSAPTLKIHDFSWEDQGFSCVDELCQEISEHLDRKFHLTQELTYYTMGKHTDVDTSKYRTAVWMYIQSLYGIRHDDYDYAEVNLMLNRPMKTFIKTICCYPERVTDSLRASVMVDFKLSEKVHVILMILEARLQAELLYFLRSVVRLNNSASVAS